MPVCLTGVVVKFVPSYSPEISLHLEVFEKNSVVTVNSSPRGARRVKERDGPRERDTDDVFRGERRRPQGNRHRTETDLYQGRVTRDQ